MEASLCIERLDEAGIHRDVIMTIVDAPEVNPEAVELIAEACRQYPDRLWAFARIHPWYGDAAAALLERAFDRGFRAQVATPSRPSPAQGWRRRCGWYESRLCTARRRSSTAVTSQ